jgi:hypothetical protein
VRLPGARMAPISSSSAWRHVRCCRNTGAKARITAAKRAGRCMAASLGGDVPDYRRPAPPPHPMPPAAQPAGASQTAKVEHRGKLDLDTLTQRKPMKRFGYLASLACLSLR